MTNEQDGARAPHILDPGTLEEKSGSSYPAHLSRELAGRFRRGLGNRLGIRNFGVNLLRLTPGAWSSQRHWHSRQDEFIYVLAGEVVLVTDGGEDVLGAGMAAAFPAGEANGHHLVNRREREALVLEIGDRSQGDEVVYSDVDMAARMDLPAYGFTRRDGTPFE